MLGLRDLQRQFVEALFNSESTAVEAQIVTNGIDAAARVDIYRNNLREGFLEALAISFPVIERLVGVDYFRQLALDFMRAHPSRAGNLHHIGAPLAEFLRERFADTQYAYLADVAALEWAHEEALVAADAEPITLEALGALHPSHYEALCFSLHPACSLVRSDFPIVRIWHANQPETSGEEIIDLRSGGDSVLVLRAPDCVEFHRLPPGEFAALAALASNENLDAALEAGLAADEGFDVGKALRHFMSLHIFTGIHLPGPESARTRS